MGGGAVALRKEYGLWKFVGSVAGSACGRDGDGGGNLGQQLMTNKTVRGTKEEGGLYKKCKRKVGGGTRKTKKQVGGGG